MNEPGAVPTDDHQLTKPVFISYATEDRKEALSVCKAIERRGLGCWISTRDVPPGENYQEAIVRALRDSRAMVLVFSDAANNSDEIKKELSLASRYRVPVMALRIEDTEPSDAFAYELSTRQWIDAFEGWDRSIDAVVERVGGLGSPQPHGEPTQATRIRKGNERNRRPLLIAAAVLALIATVAAVWWFLHGSRAVTHTLQVRLAGFERLSGDIPATFPQALSDELDAAFNKDGVISVTRAAAPSPGDSPAYAISGTIQHDGNTIKIITHLVNERSGATLWTSESRFDAANLPQIPRWAAVKSSAAVRCGLFGVSTYPRALSDQTVATYLQYCDEPSPTKGIDLAQKVVAAAPDFSWGWSALEQASLLAFFEESDDARREKFRQQGLAAAEKATQLDRANSEAYVFKAYLIDATQFGAREALLKQGIAARPLACGCEHHVFGNFLMSVGRIREAAEEFQRAADVLPLNGQTQLNFADALVLSGHPEQASQHYDAAVDLVDQPQLRDEIRIMSAPLIGQYSGLDSAVQNPKIHFPDRVRHAIAAGFAAMNSGDAQAKKSAAAEIAALPGDMQWRLTTTLLGALGDYDDALKQLVDSRRRKSEPDATSNLFFPSMLGALRSPAFPQVAQQLGLMTYWKQSRTKPDVCDTKDAPTFCRLI